MLDKQIDEIVYENGQVVGVRSQGEVSLLQRCGGSEVTGRGELTTEVWGE